MSISNWIKQKWRERFVEPVVFAGVAKMLREGVPMVRVRYRSASEPRYYTGSGHYQGGSGKRARWLMQVVNFALREDGVYAASPKILPGMDDRELRKLVRWDWHDVYAIEAVFESTVTKENQLDIIKDIVRRLKPGQGYHYSGVEIKQDFIQPDGYLLHRGNCKYLVSEEYLNMGVVFPQDRFGSDFKTKNLFVADESKIKRQHRPLTDLKRWTVLEHQVSNDNPWVIKYTHNKTAGAPVHYYGLTIDIDSKLAKGHPFYITELVQSAVDEVYEKHGKGNYVLNTDNIFIQWLDTSRTLPQWIDHSAKFTNFVDEAPVVKFNKLERRLGYGFNAGVKVVEV